MKVKSILFFIYFLLSITALCLLLIFAPSLRNEDDSNFEIIYTEHTETTTDEINQENQTEENKNTSEADKNIDGEFATSFSLNLPTAITTYVGSELILDSDFATIQPVYLKDNINIQILPTYNSNLNNVKHKNLSFEFVGIGTYKLNFSIQSKSGILEKNVKLIVQDNENATIKQIKKTLYVNQETQINEIFISNNFNSFQFTSNTFEIKDNNSLVPTTESNVANVIAYDMHDYYKVKYTFSFNVKYLPEYKIEFEGVSEEILVNISECENVILYYVITNHNEQNILQFVTAEIDNMNIASINTVAFGVISINIHSCGETFLKVSLEDEDSVVKLLRIIVQE